MHRRYARLGGLVTLLMVSAAGEQLIAGQARADDG